MTVPFYTFLPPEFQSGYDATAFLLQIVNRTAADPNAPSPLGSPQNLTKTFSINFEYCTPSISAGSGTLQLLTHGIGFDQSYWHFDYQNSKDYDYAYQAAQKGYATLSYDRLGTGESQIVSPYNEQQALVELAILEQITTLVRSGKLNSAVLVPKKVVHVGHSYGSQLTNGLIGTKPGLSDGVVLTGFSLNSTWMPEFAISTNFHTAAETLPERFGNRSLGSLTWGDKYANQFGFLFWPFFDAGVLEQAEATKQPFAVAEFLTGKTLPHDSPDFDKPVLVMAAAHDLIFCGGECEGVVSGPYYTGPQTYPAAKPLETYIQPNTGHGMNLHYNATGWYDVVFNFLETNGLAALE